MLFRSELLNDESNQFLEEIMKQNCDLIEETTPQGTKKNKLWARKKLDSYMLNKFPRIVFDTSNEEEKVKYL